MHQQYTEYCILLHSVLTRAVWDVELNTLVLYKKLINHWNKIICEQCIKGGENKLVQMFERFIPNGIDGLNVLQWTKYPHIKNLHTPNNIQQHYNAKKIDEPHHVRTIADGSLLEYAGDITTHTVSTKTSKANQNSVVSK